MPLGYAYLTWHITPASVKGKPCYLVLFLNVFPQRQSDVDGNGLLYLSFKTTMSQQVEGIMQVGDSGLFP
jgi:hypothetical protein